MEATVGLARRIERAEIEFLSLVARAGEPGGASALDVAGGRALYSQPGSPLNKVLGLGVGCDVRDADLEAIEQFHAGHASPIQIELCPLAAVDLPARLCRRGFVLKAFENELARASAPAPGAPDAGSARPDAEEGGVSIEIVDAANEEAYLDVVAAGFAAGEAAGSAAPAAADGAAVDGLRAVMRSFSHVSITRYLARFAGEPAGGGSWYGHDGTAGIIGTATIPRFRRRGIQRAVASRALGEASRVADLVIVTTDPGSVSQRTFERLGFQVVYTRAILIKDSN